MTVYRRCSTAYMVFVTDHKKFQEGLQRGIKMRQRYEVSKAMAVVRTAIRTTLIPVTVGNLET